MKKEDYAHTMATLLCLDRVMEKDLMKLSVETLAKMYINYIQNAKDANAKLDEIAKAADTKLGKVLEAAYGTREPQPTTRRH